MRSDRFRLRRDGSPRGYLLFEEPRRLRLETIVHIVAAARLRDELGWPRNHVVFESPDVVEDDEGGHFATTSSTRRLTRNTALQHRSKR